MQRRVQGELPLDPLPPLPQPSEPQPEIEQPTAQTQGGPQPPQPPKRPAVKQVEKMPEPSMVNLLEEIRSPMKRLKHIHPDEVQLDNLNEQETSDLVGILKKAMSLRRPNVDLPAEVDAEEDNNDEWN